MDFISADTGMVASQFKIYITYDGGNSWLIKANHTFENVWCKMISKDTLITLDVLQTNPQIYFSFNGGNNWLSTMNSDIIGVGTYLWDNLYFWTLKNALGVNYGTFYRTYDAWENIQFESGILDSSLLHIVVALYGFDNALYAISDAPNSEMKYIYYSQDSGVHWIRNQIDYGNKEGNILRISCLNDSTCFACGSNGVAYKTNNSGGIYNSITILNSSISQFFLYPNPTKSFCTLSWNPQQCKGFASVYNTLGVCISKEEINLAKGSYQVDLQNMPSGMYFIKIETENGDVKALPLSVIK